MMKPNELYTAVTSDDTQHLKECIEIEPEVVKLIDKDGCTPLIIAARDGHIEAVKLLVDTGADIEARDPDYKRTPIAWATFHGHKHIVEYLLEHGADVNAKDAYGNAPLKTATMGSQGAWREWVPIPPHAYEALADILRAHGASEKHA